MQMTTEKKITKIFEDYPEITFIKDTEFFYDCKNVAIHYVAGDSMLLQLLLHELAHYTLNHRDYDRDIQLMMQEVLAWQYVKSVLTKKYNIKIYKKDIDACIDTYQTWLSQRSSCPRCNTIGIQSSSDRYYCPSCGIAWKVNAAKTCSLRRKIDL